MNISHISVSTLSVLHRFGGAIERRIVEIAHEPPRRGHRVSLYSVGDTTDTREVNAVTCAACSANALINAATHDWARICDTCDELYRTAS